MRESPIEYHPAPGLGENGEEILSDLLEMRPEEITELKQSGVLA
jgi:crotonobetainyl-CoA:carnitine CoA-transferase CaiB-like acyl-CoA transferase